MGQHALHYLVVHFLMKIRKNHPILSKIVTIIVTATILVGYILLTNPNSVPLPLLLVPFIGIGYILYEATGLMMHLLVGGKKTLLARMIPPSIGFIGVALMVLSSLHQLTWKDTLLVILFTALFWLYIWRADFLHNNDDN